MGNNREQTISPEELSDSLLLINKVISETISALDTRKVLTTLIDGVMQLLIADAAASVIMESGEIIARSARNIETGFLPDVKFIRSISSPLMITGITESSAITKDMIDLGIRSALYVPCEIPEDKKICLCIFKFSEHDFSQHELYLSEILLNAVGAVLRNSMLFETVTKSRKLWIDIIDAITDFVLVLAEDGTILKVNIAFAHFIGKHPKDIIGRNYLEAFNEQQRDVQSLFGQTDDFTSAFTREVDMGEHTYMISGFPISTPGGQRAIVHILKNISDIKKLKDKLYHTDKLTSIGLLVSGVAHEINNPLTGILGYTELLKMKVQDEALRTELAKIYSSADRCKKIVENLLTFSRQRPSARSLENINDILDRTIDLRIYWFRSRNIEIETDYGPVPYTLLDPQQIQLVFLNLFINAEDGIGSSERNRPGKITLDTYHDQEKNMIIVKVTDNGSGISSSHLNKIFDPFFSTKPVDKGTGLGLSISHGIIKEHGGDISVESRMNEFTTFTVKLPVLNE